MANKLTEKKKIGNLGESVACKFLRNKGFSIVNRNYLKKWGEIDIISRKMDKLHFVEVKTVSRENIKNISHETSEHDEYRAEDNIHPKKLKRISRILQTYLLKNNIEDIDWQFDVIIVYLDIKNKEAKINYIEDIII